MSDFSPFLSLRRVDPSWDYRGAFTKSFTHGLHAYPAMMIPQVARRLIETYSDAGDLILDPFCGSGSVLVEASLLGRCAWGVDLNPVALLVSQVKTTPLDPKVLRTATLLLRQCLAALETADVAVPTFFNIDYWFKPAVSRQLARVHRAIDEVEMPGAGPIRDFLRVAFSETVRRCSNSRSREFKLLRYAPEQLKEHLPNVQDVFFRRVDKNIQAMADFFETVYQRQSGTWCHLMHWDTTRPLPQIADETVDLVVTSPPYGDSRTTVAYGQFSRLSAQWLGFDEAAARDLDVKLMGGRLARATLEDIESPSLKEALAIIRLADPTRARQVQAFFTDFGKALVNVARKLRPGGNLCIVIGNRRVRRVQVPSDLITAELGAQIGLQPCEIIVRRIPSKTMPLKNSPTNVPGNAEPTMQREYVVILRKP